MPTLDLENRFAVNPFDKDILVDKKPERVSGVELIIDEKVERALKEYNGLSRYADNNTHFSGQMIGREVEVFTPIQIQEVLLRLLKTVELNNQEQKLISDYVSKLIETSYYAGNNDFVLNLLDSKLIFGGSRGELVKRINIEFLGNFPRGFGEIAQFCNYNLIGNAGDELGRHAFHSAFTIQENVGNNCGYRADFSSFIIYGNTGDCCGKNSHDCTYTLHGNIEAGLGHESERCTFNVLDKEAYDRAKTRIKSSSYTVQLVDKCGNILDGVIK